MERRCFRSGLSGLNDYLRRSAQDTCSTSLSALSFAFCFLRSLAYRLHRAINGGRTDLIRVGEAEFRRYIAVLTGVDNHLLPITSCANMDGRSLCWSFASVEQGCGDSAVFVNDSWKLWFGCFVSTCHTTCGLSFRLVLFCRALRLWKNPMVCAELSRSCLPYCPVARTNYNTAHTHTQVVHNGTTVHAYQHRVLMTGTPMQNIKEELWPLMNFIDSANFPDLQRFQDKYCKGEPGHEVEEVRYSRNFLRNDRHFFLSR